MELSRIPDYADNSIANMGLWFSAMFEKGFLFHPDDDASSIISIDTGMNLFTVEESIKIDAIVRAMFSQFGNDVYEAAYPRFMKALGIHE